MSENGIFPARLNRMNFTSFRRISLREAGSARRTIFPVAVSVYTPFRNLMPSLSLMSFVFFSLITIPNSEHFTFIRSRQFAR